jgi:hypothetical protein
MRRVCKRVVAAGCCVGLSLVLAAPAVWADESAPPNAEALFRAGRDAVAAGDVARGCALFREANRLEPAVGTWLNLALCEERTGDALRAWQLFRDVLLVLPSHDERSTIASEHQRALEHRIGRLVLEAESPLPPGAEILINGRKLEMNALGVTLPIEPGPLKLEVRAPGHRARDYESVISDGAF